MEQVFMVQVVKCDKEHTVTWQWTYKSGEKALKKYKERLARYSKYFKDFDDGVSYKKTTGSNIVRYDYDLPLDCYHGTIWIALYGLSVQ